MVLFGFRGTNITKERMLAMTHCNTQMTFQWYKKRNLIVDFNGGEITSDAGLLLVRHADETLGLVSGLAKCVQDNRDSRYMEHNILDLFRQRIYQIVAGYEDCNDANLLRRDPALKSACDRLLSDKDLASQSTLTRLENSVTIRDLYRIGKYFVESYVERKKKVKPKRIVLDIDSTDDPTHGNQQLTFFHGYYDQYMYHPLVIYDADSGDLITTVLRPGNKHASNGVIKILKRIIKRLKEAFPGTELIIRGDAGFAIPELYEYCEGEKIGYVLGLIRNNVLEGLSKELKEEAYHGYEETGEKQRLFTETKYQARSWSCPRRVIIKAEWLPKGSNVRFVVTNLTKYTPGKLYDFYIERGGTCEVRIDELKNGLMADRLSCHRFIANQFRLFLHAGAYCLVQRIRYGLQKTEFSSMQIQQLRLRVLKIGAQVKQSARRLMFHFAEGYPWRDIFISAHKRLLVDSS